jgi:hypothetical protein
MSPPAIAVSPLRTYKNLPEPAFYFALGVLPDVEQHDFSNIQALSLI